MGCVQKILPVLERRLNNTVIESNSQSIFLFPLFFVCLERRYFFLPYTFFDFNSTGCSIPFRVLINKVLLSLRLDTAYSKYI